jgi:hypothetical protein
MPCVSFSAVHSRLRIIYFSFFYSYRISENYTNKSFGKLRKIPRIICKQGYSRKYMHKTSLILRHIGLCLQQPMWKWTHHSGLMGFWILYIVL